MAAVAELRTDRQDLHVSRVQDPKEIVAVVLADGTVKDLRGSSKASEHGEWANGSLSGRDWVLWWERRSFDES